ncbi:hypothetical protein FVQ89_09405 [Homoserinibacter sp. GY 40078]|nr:hypothetical protein FVQ89_09405 [Homoserinibacter sp. GY 40078]
MEAVREFSRSLLGPLGAPAGHVETYIEVPFDLPDGRRIYPDGLIRVKRASKEWTALVEVKTGANTLGPDQLEQYLDVARDRGYDYLITISNELPAAAGSHPTVVDRRKLRKVTMHHYSWTEILSHAVLQRQFRGVADPDQSWILGELIRYLEHPKSGAMEFDDMGPSWVPVREAVSTGTLRSSDKTAVDVALRFDALLRFACLRLGRRLGTEVVPVSTRAESQDPTLRTNALAHQLIEEGVLSGEIRIPNAISPMRVVADLRASKVTCSFDIDAPRTGRALTRINWLLRQLKAAPDSTRVEAFAFRSRTAMAELLRDAREAPAKLVGEPGKDLKSFTVARTFTMGSKRGAGRGGFIDSVLDAVETSYEELGQVLKPWAAAPPRFRDQDEVEVDPSVSKSLVSTAMSSVDESSAP